MGKKTSVYLDDQLAAEVAASEVPLATLIRRGVAGPAIAEESASGDYIICWYCPKPPPGSAFTALQEQWFSPKAPGGLPVREMYEVEILEDSDLPET